MRKNEFTGVTTWYESDPEGLVPDHCEFRLIELDIEPDVLRFAWFDSFHNTGGNRPLNDRQIDDLLNALMEFKEKTKVE